MERTDGRKSVVGQLNGWSTTKSGNSNGHILRDYAKSHSYAPPSMLDSSGNESDSSEELLYGPGFVSRLKSRYMSVALRGSTGLYGQSCNGTNRKRPGLRRTASFEEFLEKEKSGNKKNEIPTTTTTMPTTNVIESSSDESSLVQLRAKEKLTKEDYFKRCQSVEVLSVNVPVARTTTTTTTTPRPLDLILDSLANDNIVFNGNEIGSDHPSRTSHKRRSVPLLFGVQV